MDKNNAYKEISKTLRNKTPEILSEWEAEVRALIPKASKASTPTLFDHLPSVLLNLSVAFESMSSRTDSHFDARKLGKEHGKQRASETDYSLEEVLREYMILRRIVWRKIFYPGLIDGEIAVVFHQFIDESIQSAVIEFVDSQKHMAVKIVEELKREKDLREKFIAAMSHDLRTPLMAAKMSAQIILKRPETEDVVFKHVPRIVNNITRIENMVQDILDATLVKSGEELPLDINEINLNQLIEETISDLVSIYGPRFVIDVKSKITGCWSYLGLKRILENLCNNSIKYGSESEPIIVGATADDKTVTISVHNEGNPIHESEVEKLFNQFQRSTSAKVSGKKGWGIGLTLVKGLVDAHKGNIEVKSDPNDGTTFFIKLPLNSKKAH